MASPWTVYCICRHTLWCQLGITSCSCSKPLMDLQTKAHLSRARFQPFVKHFGAPVRDYLRDQESS